MSEASRCGPFSFANQRSRRRAMRHAHAIALLFVFACWSGSAGAQAIPPPSVPAASSLHSQILDQAQPDECFDAIGSPDNVFPASASECEKGTPKVNQGDVWSLTKAGNMLWYGTSPNQLCTVISSVFAMAGIPAPAFQTPRYVCEFSQSNYLLDNPAVPPELGDWRPPHIYSLNLGNGTIVDRTPDDPLISQTLGMRSAGSNNGVSIMGGPVLAGFGNLAAGINLFAFNSKTGVYLGSTQLTEYSDIRIWTKYRGVLYTGVQNSDGSGSVLRWRGNLKHPFVFEVVGHLDNEAAYIQGHRGRIYASTWRDSTSKTSPLAGLWMSTRMNASGLTATSAAFWSKIWNIGKYEADPITASVTMGGALGEEGGYLYFGTLQVPFTSALAHLEAKISQRAIAKPPGDISWDPVDLTGTGDEGSPFSRRARLGSGSDGGIGVPTLASLIVNSQRGIAIFRCCGASAKDANFVSGAGSPVELLYGDSLMPVLDVKSGTWQTVSNNMNKEPKFGLAGFGNPFNTYTWAMANFKGKLYVSTFDWSFVLADLLSSGLTSLSVEGDDVTQLIDQVMLDLPSNSATYGADLWVFPRTDSAATVESQYGVGNYLNYGIRTMVAAPSQLFIGTANPMNMSTDPNPGPVGGFELLSLRP